ncbi:organic solute transporter subunit alpha-like [Spea bombifrons]|uniref:organic solute transporter subunit alpha-like n=1 Tax=Spea bombifrons TaxID=233779 RepID=UPI00234BA418|nr:organic solute transporter subunit alpha-like [Spea bombifrons]
MASQDDFKADPRIPIQQVHLLINNFSIPRECLSLPPSSTQLPYLLDTLQLCILGILTLLSTLSVALYVEEAFYLKKKVRCPVKRKSLLWSSGAPMVISVLTCFGLWIPRAILFVDIAIGTYFATCFYFILMVIIEGFGGKDALVKKMENTDVHINTGPCCCCCPCLPRIKLTKKKLNLFILGVFQMSFLKPVFNFIGLVLWSDGIFNPDDLSARSIALWMNTMLGFCTVMALWPIGILFREAKIHLAEQNIGKKFAIFQILLILTTVQNSIFNILANSGQIPCVRPYAFKARSQMMNNHLLIIETFLLAVLARFAYRKRDDEVGYTLKPLAV